MTGPGALGLLRRFGPVALLVALLIAALVSGLAEHLSLEELRAAGGTEIFADLTAAAAALR